MTDQDRLAEMAAAWPYRDRELLSPRCPSCGALAAALMASENVEPMAFCGNDDGCAVFTWNPTKPADELEASMPTEPPTEADEATSEEP